MAAGEPITVALDANGADRGPAEVAQGAAMVAQTGVRVLLFGPADQIPDMPEGVHVVNAPVDISKSDDPARAVRENPEASIVQAAQAVANGQAQALVSGGSTGAALASGLFIIKRARGIYRPGLAVWLPVPGSPVLLLDVGASTRGRPEQLIQFAHMGSAFAGSVLGVDRPKIALLSNGTEPNRGTPEVVAANEQLSAQAGQINFVGNVEGIDLTTGKADVVVCDGFTGNVALKLMEGVTDTLLDAIRDAAMSSPRAKVGGALLKTALGSLKEQLDPERLGGAYLLGLRHLVVICHGRFSAFGFAAAVALAEKGVRDDIVGRTDSAMEAAQVLGRAPGEAPPPPAEPAPAPEVTPAPPAPGEAPPPPGFAPEVAAAGAAPPLFDPGAAAGAPPPPAFDPGVGAPPPPGFDPGVGAPPPPGFDPGVGTPPPPGFDPGVGAPPPPAFDPGVAAGAPPPPGFDPGAPAGAPPPPPFDAPAAEAPPAPGPDSGLTAGDPLAGPPPPPAYEEQPPAPAYQEQPPAPVYEEPPPGPPAPFDAGPPPPAEPPAPPTPGTDEYATFEDRSVGPPPEVKTEDIYDPIANPHQAPPPPAAEVPPGYEEVGAPPPAPGYEEYQEVGAPPPPAPEAQQPPAPAPPPAPEQAAPPPPPAPAPPESAPPAPAAEPPTAEQPPAAPAPSAAEPAPPAAEPAPPEAPVQDEPEDAFATFVAPAIKKKKADEFFDPFADPNQPPQ